jgi:ribose/xylose/arabinose/galactoside ABC-type transport system permease subunit
VIAYLGAMAFRAHFGHGASLSGNLRVVLGTALYLALIGLFGSAFGWIVRSTPGGICALVATLLVVPVLLEVIPGTWAKSVGQYLPSEGGSSFVSTVHADHTLNPWPGLLVLVIWVVAALALAAVLLRRRDG